jgi:hypothetical protein
MQKKFKRKYESIPFNGNVDQFIDYLDETFRESTYDITISKEENLKRFGKRELVLYYKKKLNEYNTHKGVN